MATASSDDDRFGATSGAERVADVLEARLAGQVAALREQDARVRTDQPDSVHQMRVAARRLRAALGTFRDAFDPTVTEPVREELRWLAQALGGTRDTEVVRARLLGRLEGEAPAYVRGPVRERIESELADEPDAAGASSSVLADPRYPALLARLEEVVADVPWTGPASQPAAGTLPGLISRDWERLARRVRRAALELDPEAHAQRLHRARRASKRLRYAAETAEPVVGGPARELVRAAARVQSALGEHHDSVVARGVLLDLAARAGSAGEDTFTYGLLVAREEQAAVEAESRFELAWAEVARPQLRRWLAPGA